MKSILTDDKMLNKSKQKSIVLKTYKFHGSLSYHTHHFTVGDSDGLCSNFNGSICCGSVVQLVVQQIHNIYTASAQQQI